ncbi:ketosteroid isomerase, partial [Pseudomonas sp. FW305-BF6]
MSNPASSLAPAIAAYIAAANARDTSRVASFFAEDANVFDEGQHQVGT